MAATRINLTPIWRHLTVYAGDGVTLRIRVVHHRDRSPFPLDGGTVEAQIRTRTVDPDVRAQWQVDAADAADGIVDISLTREQTRALVDGREAFGGVWDVSFETEEESITLVRGNLTCISDVTR